MRRLRGLIGICWQRRRLFLAWALLIILLPLFLVLSWDRYFAPVMAFVDVNPVTLTILLICGVLGILLSAGLLLTHRAVAEGRFEAFAILLTLTGVTENVSLSLILLPRPDTEFLSVGVKQPWEIRVILVMILVLLFTLSIAHLVLSNVRRTRTEQRVEEVLNAIRYKGTKGLHADQFLRLGKALIQDDYFPGEAPQELFNTKRKNRELFVELLAASGHYDMEGVTNETFLVMKLEQQPKKQLSTSVKVPKQEIDRSGHLFFSVASTAITITAILWMNAASVLVANLVHGP